MNSAPAAKAEHCMPSAGMSAELSAERIAALQRAQKNSPPHFVTKRVADPNMIPMLVAAGVEFGAVKVRACGRSLTTSNCMHHAKQPNRN